MSPAVLGIVPVGVLLAGVVLQCLLAPLLSARGKGWLAFGASLAALAGVLVLWPITLRGPLDFRIVPWDGPIALAYHIDGLSQLFALIAAGIGAVVMLYSVAYMAEDRAASRFYILMLVFIAGMINMVYSADLFILYLSWEAIGLCSFLLVGFWYKQKKAADGARKVLVVTHIAGYGLLAAVLILYAKTGSTLWTNQGVSSAFGTGLFVLTLLSAAAKSVQFPLHTWIPDAMAAPTPVSALLHAACYVKAGVYFIARLHSLGAWPAGWQTTVTWIGAVTIMLGVLFAMVQTDLKRLLAFSTVSQVGYMILGLGLGTPLGIAAGLLHCLNHSFFKSGLFLCSGAVERATGTRDMDRMGGLMRRMPKTAFMWLILAGSISGVPLLSGFVSKWLIYIAALEAGQIVPALIAWIASVLTVFIFLKATSTVFMGDESPGAAQGGDPPRAMFAGIAILAAGSVVLGVAPQLAVNYVINPLLSAVGSSPVIGVSWLGLTAGGEVWFATGGLVLAVIAVSAGLLGYYLLTGPARQTAVAGSASLGSAVIFTGGEPITGPGRLSAVDFSMILHQKLAFFYRHADMDVYYRALWQKLLAVCAMLGRMSTWLEKHAIPVILTLTLLMAAVSALASPVSRILAAHASAVVGLPLSLGVIIAISALSLTAYAEPRTRRALPLFGCAGTLIIVGLLTAQPLVRLLLLELADFVVVALVWRTATVRTAARAYLLAAVLSAAAVVTGMLVVDTASPQLVLVLLVTGFILKLALVPLYLYLPMVAESVPSVVIGMVVAVVDVTAFGELMLLRGSAAWLFTPATPWLEVALFSAMGGAVLMLAQRDLKRMVAFSSIQSMGYLLFGAAVGGPLGLTGSWFGVVLDALAFSLLFSSLASVESNWRPTLDMRGLANQYPLAGTGFMMGALAVLGVPLTAGYPVHWRLFGAAARSGPLLLGIMLLSNALAVLAYARVITVCWWGPGGREKQQQPLAQTVPLVILGLVLLAVGLWPRLLGG